MNSLNHKGAFGKAAIQKPLQQPFVEPGIRSIYCKFLNELFFSPQSRETL